MPLKWIIRAAGVFFLLAAIALSWFLVASDYSDAAASGSYELTGNGLSSNLVLLRDHTFRQDVTDAHGVRYAKGTWKRVGEGGIHFSEDFLMLPGQQGGEEDGSAYADLERSFGILIRIVPQAYEVVWYGRTDRTNIDQIVGRYETSGTHPRTLLLNPDHSFDQHEVGWMGTADSRGTWSIGDNGEVVFSKEFLKPSGQPLAASETAKAMDPRGAFYLQIEIADQEYRLSYRKKQWPWQ